MAMERQKKTSAMTDEQLKAMAAQLSCPTGEDGLRTADMMHLTNIGMTMHTAYALQVKENDSILELGHGNGRHIAQILALAENLTYFGLEISELMSVEANSANDSKNALFYRYDGEHIPFDEGQFSKVMTVNTIYFWQNPVDLLKEVYRTLKIDGCFCIGFAQKEFMQTLPFTAYGFNLYDDAKLKNLVGQTSFKLIDLRSYTEEVPTRAGEMVERTYSVAVLKK